MSNDPALANNTLPSSSGGWSGVGNPPVDIMEIAERRREEAVAEYRRQRPNRTSFIPSIRTAMRAINDHHIARLVAREIQEATDAAS